MAKSAIVWGTHCLEGASLVIHARRRSTVPNETLIDVEVGTLLSLSLFRALVYIA